MMKAVEAAPRVEAKVAPGAILRKCACQGSCGPCAHDAEKERGLVQRQAAAGAHARSGAAGHDVATSIHTIARQGGTALPTATRTTMESRFGQRDFSRVKVHTGPEVDTVARDISADAFTVGSDVFFASGKYDPGSQQGQRLLAHELTHVVQQGNATALPPQLELGSPSASAEVEADRVADDVVSGRTVRGLGASVSGPVIRRAVAPTRVPSAATCGTLCSRGGGVTGSYDATHDVCRCGAGTIERVILGSGTGNEYAFPVDGQKCSSSNDHDRIADLYQNAANSGQLRSIHSDPDRATSTSSLWAMWGSSRGGLSGPQAQALSLPAVGSTPSPGAAGPNCSPDHMVELQAGGSDHAGNLRILDRPRNENAGRTLSTYVQTHVRDFFGTYPTTRGFVEWTRVRRVNTGAARNEPCLELDKNTARGVAAGATATDIKLGQDGQRLSVIYGNPLPTNPREFQIPNLSSRAVPGLDLLTYLQGSGNAFDRFSATLSERAISRLPIRNRALALTLQADTNRVVTLVPLAGSQQAAWPRLRLTFPFLSEAELDSSLGAEGFAASGELQPSLPILHETRVRLQVRREGLYGGVVVPPDALQRAFAHVPGLRIERADLQIAVEDGQFSATGGLGFAYGRFATGSVEARLSNRDGFSATGRVDLHIPGIDDAHGEVWVRQGRLGGHLVIAASKLPFRQFVRDANLRVGVEDGRLSGTGIVNLNIPGTRDARLTFTADSLGNYSLAGAATLAIPGVRDPRVELRYENGVLSGCGSAGFTIPGLESATIELLYTNGALTGNANAAFRRGKLAGTLHATLNARHKLSGGGDLEYELAPGLVAIAGVEIDENGRTHVRGELRMPDPIQLFAERAYNKRLFALNLDIPIFGIAFGSHSVGVIATIGAEINARASIGPGQIRRPRILVAFDVENPASSASFAASAELYVPASAEIAVVIRGGIGVSLLIVKATGGIQATASAGLFGALSVPLELRYAQSKFIVDGRAELFAEPKLRFALDAFARVDADLLLTTINLYEKTWRLASFEWGSNYRVGVRFPVHYVFGEPFALSLDRLEFIAPPVDVRSAMRSLLAR